MQPRTDRAAAKTVVFAQDVARMCAGVVDWQSRITVSSEVRAGKPCIKGTRITVHDVLEYLAGGATEAQILADFPDLTQDDIRACLSFAAARERRLSSPAA